MIDYWYETFEVISTAMSEVWMILLWNIKGGFYMELKFEKEIGFCLQSCLNGCLSVGARRVWAVSGWRSWVTLELSAICYHQPFVILRAAQLYWSRLSDTLWYGLWTLIETLEPGFSASKTAGTRAGGAPDSWVTMVIMNTRAGEERRQEVCDRR